MLQTIPKHSLHLLLGLVLCAGGCGDASYGSRELAVSHPAGSCGDCHSVHGGSMYPDCTSTCHSGTGQTLGGVAGPSIMADFSATNAGDWHGARAGTGFGGTLAAPFSRGQPALACDSCHKIHDSQNAFSFRTVVNGVPLADDSIQRSGVGAEALCASCHQGTRHQGCLTSSCHTGDPVPDGQPCFFCHGHEGISNFTMPSWDYHPFGQGASCSHCHSPGWFTNSGPAPQITVGPEVTTTETTATITWQTKVNASSFVEFGTFDIGPGMVIGSTAMVWTHEVTLTGLAPGTGYVFRVRSNDRLRTVVTSNLATFVTRGGSGGGSGDATPPMLDPEPDVTVDSTTHVTSTSVTLEWVGTGGASGRYRLQLSTSPTFATFEADTLVDGQTWSTTLPVLFYPGTTYYWRVRNEQTTVGSWSSTDSFVIYSYDPWG